MSARARWAPLLWAAGAMSVFSTATGCSGLSSKQLSDLGRPGDSAPLTGSGAGLLPVPPRPAWRRELRAQEYNFEPTQEVGAAGTDLAGGRVAIGASPGLLHCLRLSDGVTLWTADLGGGAAGEAVFDEAQVLVGTDDGHLHALDAGSGRVLWTYKVQGAIARAPTVAGDLVYFVDGSNGLYALDRRTGAWRWQYRREPPANFAIYGESPAVVVEGRVYSGFSDGVVVSLDARDGAVLWTRNLAPEHDRFRDVNAEVVVANGNVYAASVAAGLYALDPASGAVRWSVPLPGIMHLTLAGGDLIAGLDRGALVRLSGADGRRIWRVRFATNAGSPGQIRSVGRDLLVVGLRRDGLFFVDAYSGQPVQRFAPAQGTHAPPSVAADGSVFFLSDGGVFYALRPGGLGGTTPRPSPFSSGRPDGA